MQTADFELIEEQIAREIPVACGYIHHGPVVRPTRSGHWLLVDGHTTNGNRMGLQYSRQNFGRRLMVEPIRGGAYRQAPGKGWAVVVDGGD